MRRILCFFLALCLFPLAVFAESTPQPSAASSFLSRSLSAVGPISTATPVPPEDASQASDILSFMNRSRTATPMPTSLPPAPKASATPTPTEDVSEKKPQPMDGMMFLHRLLFALELLDVEGYYFPCDPVYYYSPICGDAYLEYNNLLITFNHNDRTVKLTEGFYVNAQDKVSDPFCQGLPALLFALGPYKMSSELTAFVYHDGDSFLDDYVDPSVAKNLIFQAREKPVILANAFYLTADDDSFYLSPITQGAPAVSSYYTVSDEHTFSNPGINLYCLFLRFSYARRFLGVMDYNDYPFPSFSPEGYTCYDIGSHIELFAKASTMIEQSPVYKHDAPFEEIPEEDLKTILAFYFALCGRSIKEDMSLPEEQQLIRDYNDISELRSLVLDGFAPGNIVGDYRMHTQHYTNKSAKTHTLFSAGVNYDK